jgi:predicted metalloprotease with PDZ domain
MVLLVAGKVLCTFLVLYSTQASQRLDLVYTVSFPKPATHLYEVTMEVGNVRAGILNLQMPVWTPGSYLVREYARHVQDFEARDESGRNLNWTKVDKATWRIDLGASSAHARRVVARYRVYANELTVRTSHLDASHAYFNPASLLMYVRNATDNPLRLKIEAPQSWKITSPLSLSADSAGYYHAPNYDILVDSPHEVGTHRQLEFNVLGKPHRIAIWGETKLDEKKLIDDVTKIVEQAAKIFGGLPYEHYTFIAHLQPGIGGGLEHLNSTSIQANGARLSTRRGYTGFLGLIAHEYFHLWNVKRIRPQSLGPFDYQKENYSRVLWLAEGVTDYYANQLLRRANLISPAEYLEEHARSIQSYETTPGRFEQSAEAASLDSWIKLYRPDENSPNTALSYYLKGELIGWLLDFEIRTRTDGKRTLDDVMRYLYDNYAKRGVGFPESELKKAFETVAGGDLTEFFARYVSGTSEIDFDAYLSRAALQLKRSYSTGGSTRPEQDPPRGETAQSENGVAPGWLGVRTRSQGDRVVISNVISGSAGYEAGLNAGDEIAAIDGVRITESGLGERLAGVREGDQVTVTVFRRERMMNISFKVDRKPYDRYTISVPKNASPGQRRLRQAWLLDEKAMAAP